MQLTKEIFEKLQQSVDFFKSFSNGELLALLKLAATEVFDGESVIFKEGTRGDKMYIILSGDVRISRPIGGGKEEVLVVLKSGACFGEMGIIDQSPRSARATADKARVVLLSIKESVLSSGSSPLIAFKLYRAFSVMLAGRVRETNIKLQDVSEQSRSTASQMKDLLKKKTTGGEGTSFEGAILTHTDLSGAFLNNSNFKGANLVKAHFSDAKFKETNFTNAHMAGATLENLEFNAVKFANVDLSASTLKDCKFNQCTFSGTNLSASDLSSSVAEAISKTDSKAKR